MTFNLRDFQPAHLERWGVKALHPQLFLLELFKQEPGIVLPKLREQAADRGRTLEQLLAILQKTVPKFTGRVQEELPRLRF